MGGVGAATAFTLLLGELGLAPAIADDGRPSSHGARSRVVGVVGRPSPARSQRLQVGN